MARIGRRVACPVLLCLWCARTDASADDIMATKAAPAAGTRAPSQPATCTSLEEFAVTNCPLTWNASRSMARSTPA